jgi:hypothetical protein
MRDVNKLPFPKAALSHSISCHSWRGTPAIKRREKAYPTFSSWLVAQQIQRAGYAASLESLERCETNSSWRAFSLDQVVTQDRLHCMETREARRNPGKHLKIDSCSWQRKISGLFHLQRDAVQSEHDLMQRTLGNGCVLQ